MKFKYYLRGAGIGMIIATVILSIAFLFHKDLSDAEIMKRAMALGMVMEGAGQSETLADSITAKSEDEQEVADDSQDTTNQNSTKKSTAEQKESVTDETPDTSDANENIDKEASQAEDTKEALKKEKSEKEKTGSEEKTTQENKQEVGQTVSVTIRSGDVSRIVSERVQSAGLIEDAADFNAFLGVHGYDRLLHSGTYEIEVGATYEQIAKILTARQ